MNSPEINALPTGRQEKPKKRKILPAAAIALALAVLAVLPQLRKSRASTDEITMPPSVADIEKVKASGLPEKLKRKFAKRVEEIIWRPEMPIHPVVENGEELSEDEEISDELLRNATEEMAKGLNYDENYFLRYEKIFPDGLQMDVEDDETWDKILELEKENRFGARVINENGIPLLQIGKGKNWCYGTIFPNPGNGTMSILLGNLGFDVRFDKVEPYVLAPLMDDYDFLEGWYTEEVEGIDYSDAEAYQSKLADIVTWFKNRMIELAGRYDAEVNVGA